MNARRILFEYRNIEIDIFPADPEINMLFRAASMAYLKPLTFASQSGRLSEERAVEALAAAYAEGVISGSPTPELTNLDTLGWRKWLLANPHEFNSLRGIAEHKDNFKEPPGESLNAGQAA